MENPNNANIIKEDGNTALTHDKHIKAISFDPQNLKNIMLITASSELVSVSIDTLIPKSVVKLPFETKKLVKMVIVKGNSLVAQTDKSTIVVYNLQTSELLTKIDIPKSDITKFEVYPGKNKMILVGTESGKLFFIPLPSEKKKIEDEDMFSLELHRDDITDIKIACKNMIFTSGLDRTIKSLTFPEELLEIEDQAEFIKKMAESLHEVDLDLVMDQPLSISISDSGAYLYAGTIDGTIYQILMSTLHSELAYETGFNQIMYLHSIFDKFLIIADEKGKIGVLDLASGEFLETTEEKEKIVDVAYDNYVLYVLLGNAEIQKFSFEKYMDKL